MAFEAAWIHPQRLAVVGVSRGGELALLLAADFPDLVHGAVACPTDAHVLGAGPNSGGGYRVDTWGTTRAVRFSPCRQNHHPTLITGGGKNEIVDSGPATTELLELAHANGRTNVIGRGYPNAGHGVGCRQPNLPAPMTRLTVEPSCEPARGT